MKFMLEIEMGNDAVQTYEDIGFLLIAAGEVKSDPRLGNPSPVRGEHGTIRDTNGNCVGSWSIDD